MEVTIQNNPIAQLNDAFRQSFQGGRVLLTQGVQALDFTDQLAIMDVVQRFSTFNEDNDPYGEHDFGVFQHNGHRLNWKIDYYDKAMEFGSENPADSAVTIRVLTIMLADEY